MTRFKTPYRCFYRAAGIVGSALILSLAMGTPFSLAQQTATAGITPETAAACSESFHHILGGHAFLPSTLVPRAFADSTALLNLGFATRKLLSNGQELSLAGFSPRLDVQVAVIPRLAISAGLASNLIAGLNGISALQYGASTSYSWAFGALYEVFQEENDIVSLSLQVFRPHTLAVSPLNAVLTAVNSIVNGSDPDFVANQVQTQFRPTVRWAHALGGAFGVQSSLGVRINSGQSGAESGTRGMFSLGVDGDLGQLVRVPIGVFVGYARNQILSTVSSNSDTVAVGLYQTLRKSFDAGAEIGKSWTSGSGTTIGALVIRTYFD